jgi:hypothetical protein
LARLRHLTPNQLTPLFEAIHSERSLASPEAIWALWADPSHWPKWNAQIQQAEVDGELLPGAPVTIKYRRGGRVRFEVVALEPGRLLIVEARFPGARLGHEHRVERRGKGAETNHRLYIRGPLWPLFALLLGRKRMRRSVVEFIERERALTE